LTAFQLARREVDDVDSGMPIPSAIGNRLLRCIAIGVLTIVLGAFLIAYPLVTATITTLLLGWALIFVGIFQFVVALNSDSVGRFFVKAVLGILYGITGLALALFPFSGVTAITAMLGTLLVVHAGLASITAFQSRPRNGWAWFFVDVGSSLCLGLLILFQWPSNSIRAVGTMVGLAVLISGIPLIAVGGGDVKRSRAVEDILPNTAAAPPAFARALSGKKGESK